jgi:hypothetical protein
MHWQLTLLDLVLVAVAGWPKVLAVELSTWQQCYMYFRYVFWCLWR